MPTCTDGTTPLVGLVLVPTEAPASTSRGMQSLVTRRAIASNAPSTVLDATRSGAACFARHARAMALACVDAAIGSIALWHSLHERSRNLA